MRSGSAETNVGASRRRLLRATFGGAALVGAGMAGASVLEPAAAQAGEPVVGSWLMRVTGGKDPNERQLVTFLADGSVLGTNTPIDISSLEPGRILGYSTPGHGAWVRTGVRQYRSTSVFLEVSAEGNFQFGTTLVSQITVSPDGASFSGTYAAVIRDTADEVIYSSPDPAGTIDGVRISA